LKVHETKDTDFPALHDYSLCLKTNKFIPCHWNLC